jgi:hypothetical protein
VRGAQERPMMNGSHVPCKQPRSYKEWSSVAVVLYNIKDVQAAHKMLLAVNYRSLEVKTAC